MDWLNKNSILFENLDVSQDTQALDQMRQKSGQMGVPVIEVNGEIVVGFNQKRLKALLEIT